MMVGDYPLSVGDVVGAVLGSGDGDADFIVRTLRLPRVLTGILVGAALGISGAIFQAFARNPLGSPDVVGFESGAALGAVIVLLAVDGSTTQVALGATAGGFVTAVLVYVLAWRGGLSTTRLVLVGI